jgi:hypothetical protein
LRRKLTAPENKSNRAKKKNNYFRERPDDWSRIGLLREGEVEEDIKRRKRTKGVWGMPWLSETTKDVVSCEKLRGGANDP